VDLQRQSAYALSSPIDLRTSAAASPVLWTLAFVAVGVAMLGGLFVAIGESPQFSFTLAGSFLVYLSIRPSAHQILLTVVTGVLLRCAYSAGVGIKPYFGAAFISTAGFVGLAGLAALAYEAVRRRDSGRFAIAAFFPFLAVVVGFILPVTNRVSQLTVDTHLLVVSGALGFQPSFVLGRFISGRQLLWDLTATVYYALPLTVAGLCALRLGQGMTKEVRRLLQLFGCMSVAGFCLYALCPGTGPIYAFPGWFPSKMPPLSAANLELLAVPFAPRNAVPSLHLSTALLVFWNSSGMRRRIRLAAGLFLGATVFAVLALGEHYLADLIVAVPFSLMFHAAFAGPERWHPVWSYRTIAGCGVFVAGWLVLLRFWSRPLMAAPVAIALFALTLSFAGLMLRRLPRANA
jgi:hypothetical protein